MTDYTNTPITEEEEEQGIDFMKLLRQLLRGWKTIAWAVGICTVLGLVAALTMKRTYTVSTVMVPQVGSSSSSSSLSSLASLAGIDMTKTSGSELSPLIYPQIVSSTPFRLELLYAPLHYEKSDTAICMFDYARNYAKPTVMGTLKKYTIGMPGVILKILRGERPEITMPDGDGNEAVTGRRAVVVTNDEVEAMKLLAENLSLTVDTKNGYLTLKVTGSEPVQTTELALKTQDLLQREVTRFRTEKAQDELDYIQARYNEVKEEAEYYQEQFALITDRAQNVNTTRDQIEKNRLQSKYNTANAVYQDLAKQLEQAKLVVKKETPTFTVIQPVTLPTQPSNSRAKTLAMWVFFGIVIGCGIVLAHEYWPKLKEKWQATDNETEKDTTQIAD